ncbi:hypothetical protein QN344_05730 [Mucilaginibacter sp. 5B2]|nr:hypothetical protein [Mucilaginibacter sp. 5B2]
MKYYYLFGGDGLIDVQPPSTTKLWPVMCLDAGDKKNSTAFAISLTVEGLPIGVIADHAPK